MLFPEAFWGNADMFGRLAELGEQRGEYYLFYSYARISGGPVLAALVSGDAAKAFERLSCEEATRKVMAILQGIFEPKGVTVPAPLQVPSLPVPKPRTSHVCSHVHRALQLRLILLTQTFGIISWNGSTPSGKRAEAITSRKTASNKREGT